ncbi:hypothetical protein [uncultured Thiodictyon sp.]|uniref:hypothetical protein n=1 Tax=uncultured Thiodictyon sp. TaxID=1846217 RepID=UPI0025DD991C|nr:hypothetical protein [uncultured Thiodictyon sp.]
MNDLTEVELKLSVQKVNTILSALGQLPYVQVAALVADVKAQAESYIQTQASVSGPVIVPN